MLGNYYADLFQILTMMPEEDNVLGDLPVVTGLLDEMIDELMLREDEGQSGATTPTTGEATPAFRPESPRSDGVTWGPMMTPMGTNTPEDDEDPTSPRIQIFDTQGRRFSDEDLKNPLNWQHIAAVRRGRCPRHRPYSTMSIGDYTLLRGSSSMLFSVYSTLEGESWGCKTGAVVTIYQVGQIPRDYHGEPLSPKMVWAVIESDYGNPGKAKVEAIMQPQLKRPGMEVRRLALRSTKRADCFPAPIYMGGGRNQGVKGQVQPHRDPNKKAPRSSSDYHGRNPQKKVRMDQRDRHHHGHRHRSTSRGMPALPAPPRPTATVTAPQMPPASYVNVPMPDGSYQMRPAGPPLGNPTPPTFYAGPETFTAPTPPASQRHPFKAPSTPSSRKKKEKKNHAEKPKKK